MDKKITSNLLFQIVYQIILIAIPLVTTPYISRVFGPSLVGENSYSISVSNFFVIFAMLGITNYGSRKISQVKNNIERLNYEFSSILYTHLFLSATILVVYLIFTLCVVTSYQYLFFICFGYVVGALLDINWLFFGLEKFKTTISRNLIVKVFSVLLIFLFVKTKNDLWIYALILALSNAISNIYLWIILKKNVSFVKVPIKDVLSNLKPLLILFIPVIAVSIYRQMDKIMIGLLSNKTELGYYEQTEKIINIGVAIVTAIGVVMMPRCSSLYTDGKDEEAKQLIIFSNFISAFLSSALTFGLISISYSLSIVYLGNEFYPCSSMIILLSTTIIIMNYANVVRTHFLIPREKDNVYVISAVVGATINLILNIFLISSFGAIGAVVGTIAAEFVVAFVQCFWSRKDLPLLKMALEYIPFIIIGGIMVLVHFFVFTYRDVKYGWNTLFFEIIVGASVYLFLSVIYIFAFRREMVRNFIKAFKD